MNRFAKIFATCAMAGLVASPAFADGNAKGEEKLAKLLEGRTAGEPQSCIRTTPTNNLMVIDKTALVYRDGRRVWVNRTANPDSIDDDDILVIKKFSGTQLCRFDQITLADRPTGMFSGVLMLEDFVPYEKTGG